MVPPTPATELCTVNDLAQKLVIALLDHLDNGPVVVCGLSLGTWYADADGSR